MPDPDAFFGLCRSALDAGWITNNGRLVHRLEKSLADYLGIDHVLVCNNGTTALMLAIHCADLAGRKVALTPFTYVATLSAILWMGCEPVFIDVDPDTLCISPDALRGLLRDEPDIAGVVPVHVYGLACDVESLGGICREHGVVLIYDAAQAFGSRLGGRSLLDYGDYSICSFHATKVFHTAEGGCVVSHSGKAHEALALARAYGHVNDNHYCLGINAKMSELHAAMGLALLPGTDEEMARRGRVRQAYDAALSGLPLRQPMPQPGLVWNNAYYPVLLPDAESRCRVTAALASRNIFPRRYFYPSLNTLPYLKKQWKKPCPVAEDAAQRVLCLPMYGEMGEKEIADIVMSISTSISS